MTGQRTSFHFPREAAAQLNAIRSRTFLDSSADVIRIALHTYDELLDLDEKGYCLKITCADETWDYSPYKKCSFPGISNQSRLLNEQSSVSTPKNFFFTEGATKNLISIKNRSYAKTNADAIRVALAAYEELILIDEAGARLVVSDTDGNEVIFHPYRPFSREELSTRSLSRSARPFNPSP